MVKKNDPYARLVAINKKLVREHRKAMKSHGSPTQVSKDNNGLAGIYYLEN